MSYEQTIYNRLRYHGMTEAAALGMLGNWACESGNEPFRVQGDFSAYRTISKAYVQSLTNGSMTKQQFQNDQKGFGLAQWTYYSRKAELYDFWKVSGKGIDDASMQADFAVKELKRDYSALWAFLQATTDIFTATSRICREFERPAVNNIDARYAAANRIRYEIDLDGGSDPDPQPEPTPQPTPQPVIDHSLKLRTVDYHCESFDEVKLVELLLTFRGYDGFYDTVWDAVREFQKDNGLTADGVVGNMTWNKLLER